MNMSENGSPQHPEHDVLIEQEDLESSDISFEDLNLSQDLLKGVYNCGYAKPSQIQALAVPRLLRDPPEHLIAQAQSGTGKTAAFSLAILSRIDFDNPSSQAIVLSPTRELARQIVDVIKSLAKFTPASINKVIPESVPQIGLIEGQILIGTPGKLGDMVKRRRIDVSCVKMLVLDEADCMLEFQGFLQQIEIIKKLLPRTTQLIFFSATWDEAVFRFANSFVNKPATRILMKSFKLSSTTVKQFYIDCESEDDRFQILVALYGIMTIAQSIIFVKEREVAVRIAKRMTNNGHHVSFLHGHLTPDERDVVMDEFRSGRCKVLVTTNVLARGIDIDRVNVVINYDLPVGKDNSADPVTYLHRIGRTGRFGRLGVSVNFVHSHSSFVIMNQISEFHQCPILRIPTELDRRDGDTLQDRVDGRLERMEAFIKGHLKA